MFHTICNCFCKKIYIYIYILLIMLVYYFSKKKYGCIKYFDKSKFLPLISADEKDKGLLENSKKKLNETSY